MKKLTLILAFLLLWTVVCGPSTAQADIPHLISYQGRLTDTSGNAVLNGSYNIKFSIYSSEAGGAPLWFNTRSVTVEDGIFDVLLGEAKTLDLPFDAQYYLGIQVGTEQEMTPRQKLASVGYAYMAEKAEQADNATSATESTNADTVDGIHASTTPEAGKLIALDDSAKLPLSALGVSPYYITWSGVEHIYGGNYEIICNDAMQTYVTPGQGYIRIMPPLSSVMRPGATIRWEELTVYYSTGAWYIKNLRIFEIDTNGTATEKVNHTDDIRGEGSHQVIDSSFILNPQKCYTIYLSVPSHIGIVKIYGWKAKFTIE